MLLKQQDLSWCAETEGRRLSSRRFAVQAATLAVDSVRGHNISTTYSTIGAIPLNTWTNS